MYCAYDVLNAPIDKMTGEEIHVCKQWGSIYCNTCSSRLDEEKIEIFKNLLTNRTSCGIIST